MTPKKTDPDLPVSVQESSAEAWVSSGLLQVRGIQCISACMGLLKNIAIIFITWTIVWPQVKKQGGITIQTINSKLDSRFTKPHPSEQDPVSPTVSVSHQEASISLLSLSLRGQTK